MKKKHRSVKQRSFFINHVDGLSGSLPDHQIQFTDRTLTRGRRDGLKIATMNRFIQRINIEHTSYLFSKKKWGCQYLYIYIYI